MKKLWQLIGTTAFWATWPALRIYLGNTHRTRVIVKADNKVLLVKSWLGPGQWILPGGGLHHGEDGIQAAIREVSEETGILLNAADLQNLGTRKVREYGFPYVVSIYRAELPARVTVRKQKLEVTEVAWIAKKDLQDLSPLTDRVLGDWL